MGELFESTALPGVHIRALRADPVFRDLAEELRDCTIFVGGNYNVSTGIDGLAYETRANVALVADVLGPNAITAIAQEDPLQRLDSAAFLVFLSGGGMFLGRRAVIETKLGRLPTFTETELYLSFTERAARVRGIMLVHGLQPGRGTAPRAGDQVATRSTAVGASFPFGRGEPSPEHEVPTATDAPPAVAPEPAEGRTAEFARAFGRYDFLTSSLEDERHDAAPAAERATTTEAVVFEVRRLAGELFSLDRADLDQARCALDDIRAANAAAILGTLRGRFVPVLSRSVLAASLDLLHRGELVLSERLATAHAAASGREAALLALEHRAHDALLADGAPDTEGMLDREAFRRFGAGGGAQSPDVATERDVELAIAALRAVSEAIEVREAQAGDWPPQVLDEWLGVLDSARQSLASVLLLRSFRDLPPEQRRFVVEVWEALEGPS